jgi:hypothetical protein
MSGLVELKIYTAPPVDRAEILRYAGCKPGEEMVEALLEECLQEVQNELSYRLCACTLPVCAEGSCLDFGAFTLRSKKLAQNLQGCKQVVVFAATVGTGIDRLIGKYLRISPAKAMMIDAIGTERIEALCDAFCAEFPCVHPRFSPGYGDLKLAVQKDLFALLDCERKLGLCLNESLMMSPSKSVTAFLGVEDEI